MKVNLVVRGACSLILSVFLLTPFFAFADFDPQSPLTAPTNKAAFCEMHKNYGWVRAQFFNPENKLAFVNPGGYVNAGLCWWHSRLQRSATYLSSFRPNESKPSYRAAFAIIDNIFRNRLVQEIPGYSNFQSFSRDFQSLMIQYLSQMQIEDTVYFEFMRGLKPMRAGARYIQLLAEQLYRNVAILDQVQYVALKGMKHWYESHAWLFVGAVRSGNSIDFYYIDSNDSPQITPHKFTYTLGQTTLNGLVPYLQRESDLKSIKLATNRYCR